MRFVREIQFQIKNGKEKEFAGVFESEVVPMLRKQDGFLHELTMVNPLFNWRMYDSNPAA